MQRRFRSLLPACALLCTTAVASGCMSLSPQLQPTDFAELETLSDRGEREQAYEDNAIYSHDEPQGIRYTKGQDPMATKRSWQSLDAILRSDASSFAALPRRDMRISRLFTALTVVAGILTVAGTSASAREGLDLQRINGTGAILLGGGLATVGFGITAGVFYGKTRKGYERAVDIYNDSLAVRMGLNTPSGEYIPPQGVLVDEDGYIVLDERERVLDSDGEEPESASEEATVEPPPETPEASPEPALETPEASPESASPETAPVPEPEAPASPEPAPVPVQKPSRVAAPGSGSATGAPHEGEALDLLPR